MKKNGPSPSPLFDEFVKTLPPYDDPRNAEIAALRQQLETERMRLAACGTAALGYFDGCKDEYKSASLDDVLRLRQQLAECERERDQYKELHQAVTNANIELSQEKAALNDWVQGQAIDIRNYKDEIDKITRLSDAQAQTLHDTICSANRLSEQLATVKKERDELMEAIREVIDDAEECQDHDEWTAMLVSLDAFHNLSTAYDAALAKVGADKTGEGS
jgi:DNA repair ATPase RecN